MATSWPVPPLLRRAVAAALAAATGAICLAWVPQAGAVRAGTGTTSVEPVTWADERFARSPEFIRRYGRLDDRAFVQLVYRNVFGRDGDRAGVDYWTRKVGAGLRRGTFMAQQSESREHVDRSGPIVAPITAAYAMVDRLPSTAERARWISTPDPYRAVPVELLSDAAYVARWSGA